MMFNKYELEYIRDYLEEHYYLAGVSDTYDTLKRLVEQAEDEPFYMPYGDEGLIASANELAPTLGLGFDLLFPPLSTADTEHSEGYEEFLTYMLYEGFEDDIPTLFEKMLPFEESERLKPIDFDKVMIPFPHMRKRRKQWAGKPTYRTYDLNAVKSRGYAMRSFAKHFPVLTPYNFRQTKERTFRSLSHSYPWKFAKMTPFETLKTRFDDDLFNAYKDLGYKVMQTEMYTDGMQDAWQMYMSEGVFEQFLQDTYAPTIMAFAELTGAVKDFIANEWDKYAKEARSGREERYGMSLTNEQIDSLQDADLSYL